MSLPGLSGNELIAWLERTSAGWRDLLTAHPVALALPCDIRETQTVGQLLQHIVAVELRFAERISGLTETPYEVIPSDSVAAIYATHDKAMGHLRQLDPHTEDYWEEWLEFTTRSAGTLRARRCTIFIHLVMHSIRHYAQLATLMRQQGIAPNWGMDYLLMGVAPAS
jgi:uncharacterized damage-inducible protein DinB